MGTDKGRRGIVVGRERKEWRQEKVKHGERGIRSREKENVF